MAIVDLTTENDADFSAGFVYMTAAGAPINITGCTFHMGIRKKASDVAELLRLVTNDGIVVTNAVGGAFTLTITQAKLLKLSPGTYAQSLIMTTPAGAKIPIWKGSIKHSDGPSR